MRPLSTSTPLLLAALLTSASVTLALSPEVASARVVQGSFSGTYTCKTDDGTAIMTLKQETDGSVSGTIKFDDSPMTLKGRVREGRVLGSVSVNGMDVPLQFEVKREGARLRFGMIFPGGSTPDPETLMLFSASGGDKPAAADTPVTEEPKPSRGDAASSSYAGTFKGADLTITLRPGTGKGEYTGSIQMGGKSIPVKAKAVPQGLEGSFESEGASFEFRAKRDGQTLLLNSDGTTHMLLEQGGSAATRPANPLAARPKPAPVNPLAKATTARETADTPSAPATAIPAGWKTYKHPMGPMMRYPAGWQLNESTDGIQLVPPDAAQGPQGPREVFILQAMGADGLTSAEDPRVVQTADQRMGQMLPTLKRTAAPVKLRSGTEPGILMVWEGINPQTSKPVQARLYGAIHKNFAITLVAIGEKNLLLSRDKTLRDILNGFGASDAERDTRLVGTWQGGVVDNGRIIKGAGGRVQTTTASDSSTRVVLNPDGTAQRINHSRTIVNAPGVSLDSGDEITKTNGTWSAGNGKLFIAWQDGAQMSGSYRFEGNGVLVTYPNGSTQLFSRR